MVIIWFLEKKRQIFGPKLMQGIWGTKCRGPGGQNYKSKHCFMHLVKTCLVFSYFHLHPRLAGGWMTWWVGLRLATCLYTLRLFAALCSQTLRCISLHLQRWLPHPKRENIEMWLNFRSPSHWQCGLANWSWSISRKEWVQVWQSASHNFQLRPNFEHLSGC